ncbi:hypothetical protein [Ruegeria sp. HKCCA6837]|uniref:hypothetical protein n=1 Tax=Ruegeria sp. HKCCA6837 TaxID=2682989 RepID=UPI0015831559|nr:hypothetical protein [Ruegeria sp. HKCCA6837]
MNGVIACLRYRLFHASHVSIAGPVETGQGAGFIQEILLRVTGHPHPVDPTHKFALADDLTDIPFNRVQRGMTVIIGAFNPSADFQWIQQPGVQILS